MTDNKRNTRHKILGELESIKTLLEDKLNDDQDLPDTVADDDDAPLLTDALNSVIEDITSSESTPNAHDDIPVLQTALDESDWPPATSSEDDDIVAGGG
ncbi:MAG: hypothetical protein WDZ30_11715, partial [Cellvibrionaceae bacterium]